MECKIVKLNWKKGLSVSDLLSKNVTSRKKSMYWIIVIVSFVLLINIIGLLYSRKIRIWAKKEINQKPENLIPLLANFEEFVKWSPWSNKDPEINQKFSENQGEIGSFYSWFGNRAVGRGKMTLTEIKENEKVAVDVVFGKNPLSKILFELVENNSKTTLTWSMEMDMGPVPAARLMAKMISKTILKDFNSGLENLKNQVEK